MDTTRRGTPGGFRRGAAVLALCVLAAFANHGLSTLVSAVLGFPLFLDTLFTLALTFALGPLPGILTSLLTALILGLSRPQFWGYYLFVLCGIAELLAARLYQRRRLAPLLRKPQGIPRPAKNLSVYTGLFVLSVGLCFLVSILGGLVAFVIALLMQGEGIVYYDTDPVSFFSLGLLLQDVPSLPAGILARIPINIVDRPAAVFGGYGVSLLIGKLRVLRKAENGA